MKHEKKRSVLPEIQRALSIADELEKLGYSEVATKLREAVTSKKTSDASTTDEGGEGEEDDEENGNHPPKKGGN